MCDEDGQKKRTREQIEEAAKEQTRRRDDMAIHGLRSLLLLNGGGAVALLAFLQAVWTEEGAKALVPWIAMGIDPLLLGAAASGWVHFLCYETSEAYQMKGREAGREMTKQHKRATKIAFGLFLTGMGVVVTGALSNLP